jgi:D-glycero-D-manno-heptose 1,7-bisphosphate phosphatase
MMRATVMKMMTSKVVFLDKDGTLVEDIPYNIDPAFIQFTPGALDGLGLLQAHGYKLFVVTNQSGVARGLFSEQDLQPMRHRLQQLLADAGIALAGFYYCPHHPQGQISEYAVDCSCRKPQPGMLLRASQEYNLALTDSWMVGDILHDMEAGNRAGCRTILINNHHETEWDLAPIRQPEFVAQDLKRAAQIIVYQDQMRMEGNRCPAEISIY